MMQERRRIDVHNHSVFPTYRTALRAKLGDKVRLPAWSPELALELMDRQGIHAAVTSIGTPGTHLGDDTDARVLARDCNDEAAAMSADFPRLGAFATLPIPAVEAACEEALRSLDELELDGVCLLASYQGRYLGHPDFDPVLEVLNERAATILVHPTVHPSTQQVDVNVPHFMVEYPFDTTRAAVNLLFADALERFPRIRFILAHAGGVLPYLVWRISAVATYQLSDPPADERFLRDNYQNALITRLGSVTPGDVKDLLGRFYYDTALSPTNVQLSALQDLTTPSHILFGSDWPYAYENFVSAEVESLGNQTVFSDKEMAKINRENALGLFPRLARTLERSS